MSELDKIADRLDELSDAVTKGKDAINREFTMRVPAEPLRDADLVLAKAASIIRTNTKAVEALRKIAASGISGGKYQSHSSLVKLAKQTLSDIEEG